MASWFISFSTEYRPRFTGDGVAYGSWRLVGARNDGERVVIEDYSDPAEAMERAMLFHREPYEIYKCNDGRRFFVTTFDEKGDPWGHDVAGPMHEEDAGLLKHALDALHQVNEQLNGTFQYTQGDLEDDNTLTAAHRKVREVLRMSRGAVLVNRDADIPKTDEELDAEEDLRHSEETNQKSGDKIDE